MQAEISVLDLPKSCLLSEKTDIKWRRGYPLLSKKQSGNASQSRDPLIALLHCRCSAPGGGCDGVKQQSSRPSREDIRNVKHPNRQDASWLWLQLSVTYLASASKKLCQWAGDNRPYDSGGSWWFVVVMVVGPCTNCAVPWKFALQWVAANVSRFPSTPTWSSSSKVDRATAAILLKHNVSFLHWGGSAVGHCLCLSQFAHSCQWIRQCGSK